MQALIQISENNGQSVVSARELHSFLESKQDFSTWVKARVRKYGFIEYEDFTLHKIVERGKSGAQTHFEYALTLDMAKELAMVEANDKGRQARRFFIDQERKLSNLKQNSEALINSVVNKVLDVLESQGKVLQLVEPKLVKYFSVMEYIREERCIMKFFTKWDILLMSTNAKRLCKERGLEIKKRDSDTWEKGVNTYPQDVLVIVINDFLDLPF